MALPAKRDDKLSQERAVRALADFAQSPKEFSKVASVGGNADLKKLRTQATRLKKVRKRSKAPTALWDRTFKEKA
jgi:hypothetical protein